MFKSALINADNIRTSARPCVLDLFFKAGNIRWLLQNTKWKSFGASQASKLPVAQVGRGDEYPLSRFKAGEDFLYPFPAYDDVI